MIHPDRFILRVAALALTAAAFVACGSPTESKPGPLTLGIGGGPVQGTVAGSDSVTYVLHAKAGDVFAVYIRALDAGVVAIVVTPSGQRILDAFDFGPGATFARTSWAMITAATEGDYLIRVRATSPGNGGRFELRADKVITTPESAPTLFHLNDTVSAESLDRPTDIDDFEFDGVEDQEVNLFLQSLSSSTSSVHATLTRVTSSGPLGGSIAEVVAAPVDQDLESRASGRVTLPVTGRYRLRINTVVTTNAPPSGADHYRFQLYRIDRAPEKASPTLTSGDTVSSAIEHVGDVDEYTLTGTPGSTFNVFAEASGGLAPHAVVARVTFNDISNLAQIGDRLLDNPTGTFAIPSSGSVIIRVTDKEAMAGLYRGPYRLFVYPINPDPEGQTQPFVPSRIPVTGTIDQYGDVDEYRFTLVAKTFMSIRSNPASDEGSALRVSVYGPGGLGDGTLPPGEYRVRVDARSSARGGFRGSYQFVVAPTDSLPEVVAAVIAPGDTVRAETAAWPHDKDRFRLTGTAADTVIVELSTLYDAAWTQSLFAYDDPADLVSMGYLLPPGLVDATPRLELSAGRNLTISVESVNPTWAPGASVPYRLVAKRVSAGPEHRAPAIAPGDTVREQLDFVGDIDDYVIHGTPDEEINVSAAWPYWKAPPYFVVSLIDPATGAKLASVHSLIENYSQTARIPSSGEVRVRACANDDCVAPRCHNFLCGQSTHPLLDYWLVVHAINRTPEKANASFAVGDTVSGEQVEFPGDVDEFRFDGTSGQKVSPQLQWISIVGPESISIGLQLQLVDVATGDVLGTLNADYSTSRLEDLTLSPIELPRTGQYIVRVQSRSDPAFGFRNSGPYRFRIAPQP